MLRSTFALMNRSLRLDVRRRRYHVLRLVVVGWLFIFLLGVHSQSAFVGAPGLLFFRTIVWLNFVAITIAAAFFSTAISEEKEELTLELFTIAGIGPLAILLGKSINRLLAALSVLIVQIPFTLLAITLGGVTPHQIAAAYLALAAYLVLAAGIGILCSVLCARSGHAMFFTAVLLLFVHAGQPILQAVTSLLVQNQYLSRSGTTFRLTESIGATIEESSILQSMADISKTGFKQPAISPQVVGYLTVGCFLFLASWALFRLFNRGASQSTPTRGWLRKPNLRFAYFSPHRPQGDPLAWKDFHFLSGGKLMFLIRLCLIPLAACGCALFVASDQLTGIRYLRIVPDLLGLLSLVLLVAELSVQAARVFSEEVKWKALSNLALLPLSMRSIAYAKIRGCLTACAPSLFWLVVSVIWRWTTLDLYANHNVLSVVLQAVCYVAQFVLFLHIVAYCSLVVRWGTLPLAAIIFVFYLFSCFPCLGIMLIGPISGSSDLGVIAMSVYSTGIAVIASSLLHTAIGNRLEIAQGK